MLKSERGAIFWASSAILYPRKCQRDRWRIAGRWLVQAPDPGELHFQLTGSLTPDRWRKLWSPKSRLTQRQFKSDNRSNDVDCFKIQATLSFFAFSTIKLFNCSFEEETLSNLQEIQRWENFIGHLFIYRFPPKIHTFTLVIHVYPYPCYFKVIRPITLRTVNE